jgi:RecA-family ATPase
MLAGPGGVGKTMLELQIAMAVACGGKYCGGLFHRGSVASLVSSKPGKVVMVAAEESVDLIWSRLHAIVATLHERQELLGFEGDAETLMAMWAENLRIYPLAGLSRVELLSRELELTDSAKQLRTACEGARLVILDPIRQLQACDENDSGAMTAVVQSLQVLASRTSAAVMFAHHTNRASAAMGQSDTAGAARGSTALTDGVRWQLNLSRPTRESAKYHGIPDDERGRFVLADIAKANYLPPQHTEVLERLAGGVLTVRDASHKASPAASPGRRVPKPKTISVVGA